MLNLKTLYWDLLLLGTNAEAFHQFSRSIRFCSALKDFSVTLLLQFSDSLLLEQQFIILSGASYVDILDL